jgi:hypothetical protein
MFRELFGLPAHALIVHAAVVFIPLAVLAAVLYAVWPAVRKHIWWAVLGLGAIAPVTAWAARLSGEEYEKIWLGIGVGESLVNEMNAHQALGNVLSWWATALGVVMLASVLYAIPAPVGLVKGGSSSQVVRLVAAVVMVALALVTLYYVIRTGDAGARVSHNEI